MTAGGGLVALTCLPPSTDEAELAARFPKADLIEGGEQFRALFDQVVAAVEEPGSDNSHIP
ncbi:MAG: bifunctional transcriptional activator/DNA repair enzyme protein Ada, partial [Planctomycetaceae bacterium]